MHPKSLGSEKSIYLPYTTTTTDDLSGRKNIIINIEAQKIKKDLQAIDCDSPSLQ